MRGVIGEKENEVVRGFVINVVPDSENANCELSELNEYNPKYYKYIWMFSLSLSNM